MATRHNYHCTITLAQLFQIIPDIYLTGRGTVGCALWLDGPRHITVPILILLPGLCNTGYGTVNLEAGAQYYLRQGEDRRVVEQELEALIFFKQLMNELFSTTLEGLVERSTQGTALCLGYRVVDYEITPLTEESHVFNSFG